MFNLTIENEDGGRLELTGHPNYTVTSIKGLTPVDADITTNKISGLDGERFNSARLSYRNIVVTIYLFGNIEQSRITLYSFFKIKKPCTLYYSNDTRSVKTLGYVESFDCDLFERGQKAQISIICPNPYLYDTAEIRSNFSVVESLFEFPFSIDSSGISFSELSKNPEVMLENQGDIDTGVIIECSFSGPVENLRFSNKTTLDTMNINYTFQDGDYLKIDTNAGSKSVILIRDGEQIDLINSVPITSYWLTLDQGSNTFSYESDGGSEYISLVIYTQDKYIGV